MREKRRLFEEAPLKVETHEQRKNLERRLEGEEAEFKKRELEIAEERERKKAELARQIERMQAEMKIKKAAVDLEIEREELRTELSSNKTVSEIIPALHVVENSIPYIPFTPASSSPNPLLCLPPPSDVQIATSKAFEVEHEVLSVSVIS